jgi:hypothetical protein
VRVEPLSFETGTHGAGAIAVLGEEVPHAESSQRCASVIDEEWLCRRRRQPTLADVGTEQLGSLRPQGAQPLFSPFPEKPHVGWRHQLHIRGT